MIRLVIFSLFISVGMLFAGEAPSKNRTVPDLDLELLWVAPGEVVTSAKQAEVGKKLKPARTIKITEGFWLGKYETTQAQFKKFIEASGYKPESETKGAVVWNEEARRWMKNTEVNWKNAWPENPQLPIVCVSWNDAMEFCRWLTEKERKAERLPEGYEYSLPLDDEWEYACRAGSSNIFSHGDSEETLGDYAWFILNNAKNSPQPVGLKKPNAFGFYDMHGNIWEWCFNPHTNAKIKKRGKRGGSYDNFGMKYARCDVLLPNNPDRADPTLGFRIALRPKISEETAKSKTAIPSEK